MTTKQYSDIALTAALMGVTNALITQPEGLGADTLWSQTQKDHPGMDRADFDTILQTAVDQQAFVRSGDRYALSPDAVETARAFTTDPINRFAQMLVEEGGAG